MVKKAYQYTRRISMIAAFYNGKVIATFLFEGSCNKSIFESYIQAIFIKELNSEQISTTKTFICLYCIIFSKN
ncbi:putative transposase [Orientia tsutsugamushi str. Kato PP]|nr:putative transposase [Orientia tsutsugamushi str. Kato PP]